MHTEIQKSVQLWWTTELANFSRPDKRQVSQNHFVISVFPTELFCKSLLQVGLRSLLIHYILRTPWSKKMCHIIICITPIFRGRFFTLHVPLETELLQNLQLHLNCVFNCCSGSCSLGWPWPTASCSAFDRTDHAQLSQKVIQCLFFLILLGISLTSLWEENPLDSCTFWSKFCLEHSTYFILLKLLYCCYVQIKSMKWTLQCDVIMTSL